MVFFAHVELGGHDMGDCRRDAHPPGQGLESEEIQLEDSQQPYTNCSRYTLQTQSCDIIAELSSFGKDCSLGH